MVFGDENKGPIIQNITCPNLPNGLDEDKYILIYRK